MSVSFEVTGFKDVDKAIEQLSKSAGKGVLRRSLKSAAEPMAEIARSLAPNDPLTSGDDLGSSIAVSTKLSKRQAAMHRKMFRDDRASVEMFIGPAPDPAAWNQEFGNVNHGPQPFMRPAWDQDKMAMLDRLSKELWAELEKAVKRAERRAARG